MQSRASADASARRPPGNRWPGLFNIYGPRIIKTFHEEDAAYFTCDARMGAGTWEKIAAADYGAETLHTHPRLFA